MARPRKTGYKPAPFKIGDGGFEEAEALMLRSKQLLSAAQDDLMLILKDINLLDNDTRMDVHRMVNENSKAVAALFREERTNDRFSAEKAEDMDDARRKATIVETYRRLPAEARTEVAKMMLEMMDAKSADPTTHPAEPGGSPGHGQILRLRPRDDEGTDR